LLALAIYWIGLPGPFVFDDTYNLLPIQQWLKGDRGWLSVLRSGAAGTWGRPISMGSFLVNVWLLGPGTWGLKLGNVLLHLLNASLVYALFRGFAAHGGLVASPSQRAQRWLPLFAAALWLLHPLLVSTVLYVVQRMAMLSALFTLLAMLAFLHGRVALRDGARRRGLALLLLVPLMALLAALSKENGVLAIPLCGLLEWLLFAPRDAKPRAPASTAFVLATLAAPAVAGLLLVASGSHVVTAGYANRPFTLTERLLTQPRVLWDYVGSLLLPVGPSLGLYHDDYPISHGLLDPAMTLFALLGWIIALAIAWRLRRRIPGLALGLGIFLVGQALESSAFPLLMYFEHRNYLPAVGGLWAMASVLCALGQALAPRMHNGARVFLGAGAGLILVFALATAARAGIWSSQASLIAQGLATHPGSRWLRMDAAQAAMTATPPRPDEARMHMAALANASDPDSRRIAGAMRLLIDCNTGSPTRAQDEALAFDGRMQTLEADALLAFERLADAAGSGGCKDLSASLVAMRLQALADNATLPDRDYNVRRLRFKAAQLYVKGGDLAAGLQQATRAYVDPAVDAPMAAFAAQIDIALGRYADAQKMLDAADAGTPEDELLGHEIIDGLKAQARDAQATQGK
jgi:hypothetical protein